MDSLSIGLLLPSSTIFPVAKDFENGVKDGLAPAGTSIDFQLKTEFIGQGSFSKCEEACNKLFNYDNVDLITGVLSNRIAEKLADKFLGKKKPLIVNNAGGHYPDRSLLNDYVFINSLHLWQHAWVLGYMGVKKFGRKGMFVSALYESGYSFSDMFYRGMMAADPQAEWSFSVAPPPPTPSELTDMSVFFQYLEQYQPDFIFAGFCGEETTLFLEEIIKRGWHKRTKICGLPFLLNPFHNLSDDLDVYTTSAFPDNSTPADKTFYHLGKETGIAIVKAMKNEDAENLQKAISMTIPGKAPTEQYFGSDEFIIYKNAITAAAIDFKPSEFEKISIINLRETYLNSTRETSTGGWMNPYLCI